VRLLWPPDQTSARVVIGGVASKVTVDGGNLVIR
jgi:hypothetical protein